VDRLKRILVGIDFSACSAAALLQAVRIAAWHQSRVAALHVVPIPAYAVPDGAFMPVDLLPPVDLLLDAGREQWANWPPAREIGNKVAFNAVLGISRMELLSYAQDGSFDLLVVGAHSDMDGKRGVGSTAAACVQRAATRVLVVRERQTAAFRSVVACIDFSDTSRVALEQAIRFAAQDGAALHILHVYDDPWRGVQASPAVKANQPRFHEMYQQAVEKRLQSFCEPLSHEIAALKGAFHSRLFDGHGKGILDFIQREGCDLAVLGTRGKWNLRDFFWGSTAERVVRDAPCSVLTVKPPGFQHT
jgi:nucleotide-binding universal stress UspA family protein